MTRCDRGPIQLGDGRLHRFTQEPNGVECRLRVVCGVDVCGTPRALSDSGRECSQLCEALDVLPHALRRRGIQAIEHFAGETLVGLRVIRDAEQADLRVQDGDAPGGTLRPDGF